MNRLITILCTLASIVLVASCKVDTYSLPDARLHGALVCDDGTNLITEQPNGFKIRLYEIVNGKKSTIPQDFWGKADGTFNNSKIFKGNYIVQPIEGAFFDVDPVEIRIEGDVTLNFDVTPFCTITANITSNGSDIIAKYKITKDPAAGKIETARLLITKWNPNVGMNYVDKEVVRDLSSVTDETIQKTTYSETVLDYVEEGVTYYARVAVLCSNTSGRYNMSEVIKIETE